MLFDHFMFRPKISIEILSNMQSGLLSNNLTVPCFDEVRGAIVSIQKQAV